MKKVLILMTFAGLLTSSCGNGEPETRTDFIIKNSSSFDIELEVFNAWLPNLRLKDTLIKLAINSEFRYYYNVDGENASYFLPFGYPDSAYIVFSDTQRIIYRRDDLNPRNILDINSYEGGKVANSYFIYTYYISDEDYENALAIK
ncbi:MAG: hypothetical protein RBT49_04945 [Bacteroidales bacterium]|nr:hypothetical protein [Bacteroidales bacterium]